MTVDATRLGVEYVQIARLFPNPANPRHNDEAVPHVAASIRRFGWQQPIVAKRSGEVIAGHTRLAAARELGQEEVPVIWFDGTDLEATAYAIADNRTAEFATWDEPALAKLLEDLRAEDALDAVGFSDDELEELIAAASPAPPAGDVDDPGPGDPPEKPVSRPGDLWVLGDHKLLCGDSTKAENLERLMAGEKAALLSADPPYCVNYSGNDRGKGSGKDWSHLYREIDIKDLGDVFAAVLPHVEERTAIYVWHAHVQQHVIIETFARHDLIFHQVVVWVKPTATFGHAYYRWKHEPCAFGWRRGHKPKHGSGSLETVWEIDWEGKARIATDHPTSKPVRLFEIPMEQHTRAGDLVLEPFSGSGSQLVAAEKLRRRCRALEIQPAFVDVAVRRWEQASGKSAVLDGTDQTFAEIEEAAR